MYRSLLSSEVKIISFIDDIIPYGFGSFKSRSRLAVHYVFDSFISRPNSVTSELSHLRMSSKIYHTEFIDVIRTKRDFKTFLTRYPLSRHFFKGSFKCQFALTRVFLCCAQLISFLSALRASRIIKFLATQIKVWFTKHQHQTNPG